MNSLNVNNIRNLIIEKLKENKLYEKFNLYLRNDSLKENLNSEYFLPKNKYNTIESNLITEEERNLFQV